MQKISNFVYLCYCLFIILSTVCVAALRVYSQVKQKYAFLFSFILFHFLVYWWCWWARYFHIILTFIFKEKITKGKRPAAEVNVRHFFRHHCEPLAWPRNTRTVRKTISMTPNIFTVPKVSTYFDNRCVFQRRVVLNSCRS